MVQYAEVPIGHCAWEEGEVIEHDEDAGIVTIQADDGTKYQGCESLARFFTKLQTDQGSIS